MRVLLWMTGADAIQGGHKVQIEKTAEALRAIGVDSSVSYEPEVDLAEFDLVHGFSISRDLVRRARQRGLPVVISTIYCDRAYRLGLLDQDRRSRLIRAARVASSVLRRGPVATAERLLAPDLDLSLTFESADLLLPNSNLEAKAIYADLKVTTACHVVPNAVDPDLFFRAETPGDGVLYVGRIDPYKNQLGLIRALKGMSLRTVLVGSPHPHHMQYYWQCRREAGSDVSFIDHVPHSELGNLYRAARVHAMPSRFETTGLTSLEAALCGCGVVSTRRGYVREYFEDLAYYCDPDDLDSIRTAVYRAAADESQALRERILARFTWEHTAEATLAGYQLALQR